MTELFIEEQQVELPEGTVIAITKQATDIGDIQNRKMDRTNSFTIPHSMNNDKVMENANRVESGTLRPFRKLGALVKDDGIDEIRKGVGILNGTDQGGYRMAVYSGLLDFWDAIEGKQLRDLDLSAEDHSWSALNAANSQGKTSGYIYAVCEFGGLSNPGFGIRDIDVRGMVFSLFVNTIVDQIFTDAGFTKSGAIFADQKYLDLILPMSNDNFSIQEGEDFSASKIATQGPTTATGTPVLITFPIEVMDEGGNYDGTDEYTVPINMSGRVQIKVNITTTGISADTLHIRFRHGGTTLAQVDLTANVTAQDITIDTDENYTTTLKLDVAFNKTGASDTINVTILSGEFEMEATPTKPLVSATGTVGTVYVSENLPAMSQKDFLKNIMNMFALVPLFDPTAPLDVEFKDYEDLFTAQAKDMSEKLDLSREVKIEFTPGEYAQTSVFKYKTDNANADDNLGRGTFTIDDLTLEDEKDVINIDFSPSRSVTGRLTDGINVAPMSEVQRFTRTGSGFRAYALDQSINPRILRKVTVNKGSGGTFDFHQGASPNAEDNIDTGQFLQTDGDIGGQEMLDERYVGFQLQLARYKMVIAFFNLTALDFYDVDHFEPWSVTYFGANFYVNKIQNYISGQPTKVELIRL